MKSCLQEHRVRSVTDDSKEITTMAQAKSTIKSTAKTSVGFTRCPACVNGKGSYKDIVAHNKRHHGGRTPKAK